MTHCRRLTIMVVAGVIAVACGKTDSRHKDERGTVGTSGRRAGTSVESVVTAEPPPYVARDREGTRLWDLTKQFYLKRDNATAWIEDRKPRAQMDALVDALQHADRDGLDPALYNASTLAAKRQEAGRGFLSARGFDESEAAGLDVWLTYLYMQYASDLADGLSNLSHADPQWKIQDKRLDVMAHLDQALDQNRVGQALAELTPSHAQYTKLRDAFQQYRQIAQQGGWPQLPAVSKLKPGQQHAAVPVLAKRLSITGDFTGTVADGDTTYGADLQEAVKRFQRRHGLTDDGVIAPATVAQLNVPVERRIGQIALSLERWRWLPRDLGERYVLVNIPEYRLEVWDHGQVPLSMRVIVGKKSTPTPIFTDDMTHIIFAPYWNIPPDIAANETIPSMMRDPAFLQRMNMEVLDKSGTVVDPGAVDVANLGAYRIRQRPGASNALGYVKFMFPNQFNVYLHDTPTDSLFERASRSLSHGCVRLAEPEKLAQYVLADQPEWTPEQIDAAMHGGVEKTVKLKTPIPVYLGYFTARVSADGILQFRDDLYGIDAQQTTMINETLDKRKAKAVAAAARVGGAAAQARNR
jgi:murein L,D-transpeptidase YcbB/YkuD